jgi:hypothetical protein
MSVKIENTIKKKLETVSLSHSTPVNTEERESALLAAAFRELSSLIEFLEPAWYSGVSKLRSLTSDVSRTRSAWIDNLAGGGSSWRGAAAASYSYS